MTGHGSKYNTLIQNNCMMLVLSLFPFYRWENQGTKSLKVK